MSKSPSATSQVSKEAAHEYAMKLTNDVLQNREPVAAAVLVWGWILKQVSELYPDGPMTHKRTSIYRST